jgi:hypothetical protein
LEDKQQNKNRGIEMLEHGFELVAECMGCSCQNVTHEEATCNLGYTIGWFEPKGKPKELFTGSRECKLLAIITLDEVISYHDKTMGKLYMEKKGDF